MTRSFQNLNSKLRAQVGRADGDGVGAAVRRAPAGRASAASVRIAGTRSSYRGGYHLSGR